VTDLREESTRSPEFSATATRVSMTTVATIPMRLADKIIGALNLYSTEPRYWWDMDIEVAEVMADVATATSSTHPSYASKGSSASSCRKRSRDGSE